MISRTIFFDIFYIGEGETVFEDVINAYREARDSGMTRQEFLEKAVKMGMAI